MTENEKAISILRHMRNLLTTRAFEEEALEAAIHALDEAEEYRTLGTPEELKELKERAFTGGGTGANCSNANGTERIRKNRDAGRMQSSSGKRDRDRKNVRKDTKLTYRELAEYCETRADCSRCKKYELCERLSDYVEENLAPVEVVKMVDSKEKLS